MKGFMKPSLSGSLTVIKVVSIWLVAYLAIYLIVTDRFQQKPTPTISAESPEQSKIPDAQESDESIIARKDWQWRVMSDGKQWFVQENLNGWWQDDVFGGYFNSLEDATNRIAKEKKFWCDHIRDKARKALFKPVNLP